MKIYVASTLSNYTRVRKIYDWIISNGLTVSFDWTAFAEEIIDHPPAKLTEQELRKRGQLEIAGVHNCDILLLIEPANKGSYTEFGYAKALNKPIIVLNDQEPCRPVSFHYLEDVFIYKSELDALNKVREVADELTHTRNPKQ